MLTLLTESNIARLAKGTILLKCPLLGEPLDNAPADLYNNDGQQFQIVGIGENDRMELAFPPLRVIGAKMRTILMNAHDLIAEKAWWI